MEKSPSLISPEQTEKRKKILFIVASYRERHPALCNLLKEKVLTKGGTTYHELTDILLHDEIEVDLFNKLATIADDYLNGLSESERIKALDQATNLF